MWRFEAKAAKNPKEFDLESVVTEAMGFEGKLDPKLSLKYHED